MDFRESIIRKAPPTLVYDGNEIGEEVLQAKVGNEIHKN